MVTHYLTSRRSRQELLRTKLEELFLAANGFCLQFSASSFPYSGAMRGKITYDQANDLSTKGLDTSARHFEKTQMLVNLYYPQVLELFDQLIAARDKANTVRVEFRNSYAQVQRSLESAKRFDDALTEFDELGKLLILVLAGLSRDMIRPPSMLERARRWPRKQKETKNISESIQVAGGLGNQAGSTSSQGPGERATLSEGAFRLGESYKLREFSVHHLQPEFKTPDLWFASMGSGQPITDPFLGFLRRVFWPPEKREPPGISEGIFFATWALTHAIDVNPGGINGPLQLAVLKADETGQPRARELPETEIDEHRNYIQAVEEYLGQAPKALRGEAGPELQVPKIE